MSTSHHGGDPITVTTNPTVDDSAAHEIDTVTLERQSDNKPLTLSGPFSTRIDGFRWQFLAEYRERIGAFCREHQIGEIVAVGTRDEGLPLRGYISQLAVSADAVAVLVVPPRSP